VTALLDYKEIQCIRNGRITCGFDKLTLTQGDRLGIIGPNGAGKSTLLKACSLLDPPDKGMMTYKGKSLSLSSPPLDVRREWACVFQHSQRFQGNVYKNVEIGLSIRKIKKEERHNKVMHWLKKFQIEHLADADAASLSGGEAQRMNLARAFATNPKVLFLDEPFSALDFPTKTGLINQLNTILRQTNTTMFFITHDLIEIRQLTNRLIYIEKGKVFDNGDTGEVLSQPSPQLNTFLAPWQTLLSI
jgi:tungstate transport system ATP-binding protein